MKDFPPAGNFVLKRFGAHMTASRACSMYNDKIEGVISDQDAMSWDRVF